MAVRKKAKAKPGKAPAKRPVARKKAAKKPAKKAPLRRAATKARKPAARPAARAKPAPVTPVALPPPGDRIGIVTHYFSNISVAVVKIESGRLRVGDTIHIRGHTTDFKQRIDSLQVEHKPVPEVGPNDDFGLKVGQHARENDVVYLVR
ncbi:MAG: EF-Tu/IF-2/RF-3 family GTPase [Burkholderiales bacterium]